MLHCLHAQETCILRGEVAVENIVHFVNRQERYATLCSGPTDLASHYWIIYLVRVMPALSDQPRTKRIERTLCSSRTPCLETTGEIGVAETTLIVWQVIQVL